MGQKKWQASDFSIMSRQMLKKYLSVQHSETSLVISIINMDENPVYFPRVDNGVKYHRGYQFDDVECREPSCITTDDARDIAGFTKAHCNDVDRIIVQCEAGISRSAGVCAAIMNYLYGGDWAIFENKRYCPNRTCYRYVLNALYDDCPPDKTKN